MFATIKPGESSWNISLYRIINIKKTDKDKITEFSSINYSTKPVVLERLILKYDTTSGSNKNYWYTESEPSDYSFNYKDTNTKSDRCWKDASGVYQTSDGQISYSEFTLTVKL